MADKIPANEDRENDLAELEVAATNDASAMDELLETVPEVDPAAPPEGHAAQDGPRDVAQKAAQEHEAEEEVAKEEAKKAPPAKKEGEKAPTKDESIDEDLEKEVEERLKDLPKLPANAPPHAKEALKVMRQKLKDNLKEMREVRKERDLTKAERDEIKQQLAAASKVDPDELNSLLEMRRAIDIGKDPQFIKDFEEPIREQEREAFEILNALKMPKDISDWINAEGGLAKFYYSSNSVIDPDSGKPLLDARGNVITQSQWFKTNIMDNRAVNDEQRDEILDHVRAATRLTRKRDTEIKRSQKHGEEWEAKQVEIKTKEEEKVRKEVADSALAELKKLGTLAEVFTPSDDATPEQKKEIEIHNKRVEEGGKMFHAYMAESLSPAGRAKAAVHASLSHYLKASNTDLKELLKQRDITINDLNDKLTRFKRAGQTSNRTAAPPPGVKPGGKTPANETDEEAMDREMAAL